MASKLPFWREAIARSEATLDDQLLNLMRDAIG
jgi:hypothetical protein